MPRSRLPAGRHLALTWSIPDDFGGMTAAMLHRSRAFRTQGGVDVDILTLDDRVDYPAVTARLRTAGALIEGMTLQNLYDWLRAHPLPPGAVHLDRHAFTPLEPADPSLTAHTRDGVVLRRERRGTDGTVLQVDHYRLDGSLVVSDRRDTRRPGRVGGRSVVVCDAAGRPLRSWPSIGRLYTAWLDALTVAGRSWLIIDSKTAAQHVLGYRRRGVVTVHVVHGAHRAAASDTAGVAPARREVFARLRSFDAVVLLTARQRAEVRRLVGRVPNLAVIPLGIDPALAPATAEEERAGAVVLARLSALKRVDHAVEAVRRVNAARADAITLDIWGDGRRRRALEEQTADDPAVRLHPHDPSARGRLGTASLLLLTSRSEGFGLVLLEAMAAGCVPIAYDVPYGPGEIIHDGADGYLVPAGDIPALAEAIIRFLALSPAERERVRAGARRRAADFSDERITAMWARTLRTGRARMAPLRAAGALTWRARRMAGAVLRSSAAG